MNSAKMGMRMIIARESRLLITLMGTPWVDMAAAWDVKSVDSSPKGRCEWEDGEGGGFEGIIGNRMGE